MSGESNTVQTLEDSIHESVVALTWKEDELHGTDDAIYWKEHDLRALQARRKRLVTEIHALGQRLSRLQRRLVIARQRRNPRILVPSTIYCPCASGARMYARP